jgi:hypothetical protein
VTNVCDGVPKSCGARILHYSLFDFSENLVRNFSSCLVSDSPDDTVKKAIAV